MAFPQNETAAEVGQAKGETIWKISAPKRIWATDWPVITYGNVPDGFSQALPMDGRPPELAEGHMYVARAHDTSGSQSNLFFAIRGGKAAIITDEILRSRGRGQ